MTRILPRLHEQHGTAMVEMALVMPILLLIVLGIVDFGRVMNYWNNVNQIASDGARFAAVNSNPGTTSAPAFPDFRQWLRAQAETGELRDGVVAGGTPADCPDATNSTCSQSVTSKLNVCVDSPTGQPLTVGNPIRIRVESSYNLIPLVDHLPFLTEDQDETFGSVAIKGEAVMRLERDYDRSPLGCTS